MSEETEPMRSISQDVILPHSEQVAALSCSMAFSHAAKQCTFLTLPHSAFATMGEYKHVADPRTSGRLAAEIKQVCFPPDKAGAKTAYSICKRKDILMRYCTVC